MTASSVTPARATGDDVVDPSGEIGHEGVAPGADTSLHQARRRHVSDLVRVVLGLVVLFVASLPVRPDTIARMERGAFDLVNGLPDFLYPVLWGPMQLGSLMAVPIVVIPALVLRRRRLAIDAAITGTAAWTLAKVVKDGFGRPRPGGLLDEVAFRGGEPTGMGFVSGHTAVAFALATAVVLHLPRRWRGPAFGLAALVGIARIFVGAHLPLDVVGGAALGWAISAAYRWAVGAPTGRPPTDRLADALRLMGLDVRDLVGLPNQATNSAPYRARVRGADGQEQDHFVKVVSDRPQDRDALHRWWLRITRRQPGGQRFRSPLLQVTHEAAMTSSAREAGVPAPAVVLAAPFDGGSAVLVTAWTDGTPVGCVHDVPLAVVDGAFAHLAELHGAGLTHGDLGPDNLLLAGDRITFVDFGDGHFVAPQDRRDHDIVRLLLTFSERGDAHDTIEVARARLGHQRVAQALAGCEDDRRAADLVTALQALGTDA